MLSRFTILTLILWFGLPNCSIFAQNNQKKIHVAVASSLLLQMQKVSQSFEKQHNCRILWSAGASGMLVAQIRNQAPYDVFIAADESFPQVLFKEKIGYQPPKIFMYGKLVVWTKEKLSFSELLTYLKNNKYHKIALAQPETAPFGRVAVAWLQQKNLLSFVKPHLIYGENVGKVNQYIFTQSVAVAFTSSLAMASAELKNKGYWLELPASEVSPIPHAALLLRNNELAKKFYDFLFSPQAKIL